MYHILPFENVVQILAQIRGNDLPWQDSRQEMDVGANLVGITIAEAFGRQTSCVVECRRSFESMRDRECCQVANGRLLMFSNTDPNCDWCRYIENLEEEIVFDRPGD